MVRAMRMVQPKGNQRVGSDYGAKVSRFELQCPLLDSDIEIYTKSSRNYEQHYLDNCFICGFNIFT